MHSNEKTIADIWSQRIIPPEPDDEPDEGQEQNTSFIAIYRRKSVFKSFYPFSSEYTRDSVRNELNILEALEEKLRQEGKWKLINCSKCKKFNSECPYCRGAGKVRVFIREYLPPEKQERLNDLKRLFEIGFLKREKLLPDKGQDDRW